MLHIGDTPDEEDVLTIFDELEVPNLVNLVLLETTLSQNFIVNELPATSFPTALHVMDIYACGLRTSKQTRTRLCSCPRFY